MPGARPAERQNDSAPDFGVSCLASACRTRNLPPIVAEIIPVDANTQTAASNNQPVNPPFIRSGHLAVPGFSEHRIYWEEYGSLAGEPVIVMHGDRVQAATARPPDFSIRSGTVSCFLTSAVAARARPVRAMMTQHRP